MRQDLCVVVLFLAALAGCTVNEDTNSSGVPDGFAALDLPALFPDAVTPSDASDPGPDGGTLDTTNAPETMPQEDLVESDQGTPVDGAGTEDAVTPSDQGGAEEDVNPVVDTSGPSEDSSTMSDASSPEDIAVDVPTVPDSGPEPCSCGDRVCGDDGCGGSCGVCEGNTVCNVDGQCVTTLTGVNGSWCDVPPECVLDPETPDYDAYYACVGAQCLSGICSAAQAYLDIHTTCSRACTIDPQFDLGGKEAPDAPVSDCQGFVNGPAGSKYVCVDVGFNIGSYCLPGTFFNPCISDADCPTGEGCFVSAINSQVGTFCMTKNQSGPWGEAGDLGTSCVTEEGEAPVSCESGLCYNDPIGCSPHCAGPMDCVTDGAVCELSSNQCLNWPGRFCTADHDCSALMCRQNVTPFGADFPSPTNPLTTNQCFLRFCDDMTECPDAWYCRQNWDGQAGTSAGWEHICLPETEGGAALGEPCGADTACASASLCVGGYCAAICSDDSMCDADQFCGYIEFDIDSDEDGTDDTSLPLAVCRTFPGFTTECRTNADCSADEACRPYGIGNESSSGVLDPEGPYTVGGKCVPSADLGEWGDACTSWSDCSTALCIDGRCSHMCESFLECPPTDDGAGPAGVCSALIWSRGGDYEDVTKWVFVSVCRVDPIESAPSPCDEGYVCGDPSQVCIPFPIAYGPEYDGRFDALCLDATNSDGTTPDIPLGAGCDPNAANAQCLGGFCVSDPDTPSLGTCSKLCDDVSQCRPACTTDAECGGGITCVEGSCDTGLECVDFAWNERAGSYADNRVTWGRCERP